MGDLRGALRTSSGKQKTGGIGKGTDWECKARQDDLEHAGSTWEITTS